MCTSQRPTQVFLRDGIVITGSIVKHPLHGLKPTTEIFQVPTPLKDILIPLTVVSVPVKVTNQFVRNFSKTVKTVRGDMELKMQVAKDNNY